MKTKYWLLLIAAMLALAIAFSIPLLFPGPPARQAEIWSQGVLVKTVELNQDQEFPVVTDTGSNTVTVRDGKIAVTQATCPDHYCMHRGFCHSGADIVCLPNKLVIVFVGETEVDMVVG